jgi:hypothetical protein
VLFFFIPPIESHFLNYAKGAAPMTFGTAPFLLGNQSAIISLGVK